MYDFTLAISCPVKTSNIPSKFIKYIDVPLFKAVTACFYPSFQKEYNTSNVKEAVGMTRIACARRK